MDLIGGVPFDGRRLDESTAESMMLHCIDRLRTGKYDGTAQWLLWNLMSRGWGYTPAVQAAIDGFQGEQVDALYLRARQLIYGYGVDQNMDEAFRMWREGVNLGDRSGRCHHRIGVCRQHQFGAEQNIRQAIEMYRNGVALGSAAAQCQLGYCYEHGEGVPRDLAEAKRLYTLSHLQGYVIATYYLAKASDDNIPLRMALFREAAARGHEGATAKLLAMRAHDPSSVIPFGWWFPRRHVHRWVSDSMHREMISLMIAQRRPDGLVNTLPRLVVSRICFFLACRPQQYTALSEEAMQAARLSRQNWLLERRTAEHGGDWRP